MDLDKKLKQKNKIIIVLSILLSVVVIGIIGVFCFFYFNYYKAYDMSQNKLEGKTILSSCYDFGLYCDLELGSYDINGKKYAVMVRQYPTSGVSGSFIYINGKKLEINDNSWLDYIELFNDQFFLVKTSYGIYFFDLELNKVMEYRVDPVYDDIKTIKKDNKYYIEYNMCSEDNLVYYWIDLSNFTETNEIYRVENADCFGTIRSKTKYFEND